MTLPRWLFLACLLPGAASALEIGLPTDNDAVLRKDNEGFYQPTVEGSVESGMFGCVRRSGRRFHEGIDIRCLRRDKRGEPLDEVRSAADGTVAFFNDKPGLSNYGRYVVIVHNGDGVGVFTLYAHLAKIAADLKPGLAVRKGQRIGILGYSSNTHEGIPRERAHLHFEVNFLLNEHFDSWYRKRDPKAPPFGSYNGQNLFSLDPAILLRAATSNSKLNFAEYVARQPVAFTVLVGTKTFSWLKQHPEQIQRSANPGEKIAAYEIGVTAWGTPLAVWPRAEIEVTEPQLRLLQRGQPVLARINEATLAQNGCRGLVQQGKRGWELSEHGQEWCALLTYTP
jgi:hypothetical protein